MMVAIQAHHCGLALAFQLAITKAVLTAVMSFNAEATVGPELALGTKTMRTLDEDDQQGGAHRTDVGNLAKQAQSRLFVSFPQKLHADLLTQNHQTVHLLIVDLSAAT